jgi:hypothetical protein
MPYSMRSQRIKSQIDQTASNLDYENADRKTTPFFESQEP